MNAQKLHARLLALVPSSCQHCGIPEREHGQRWKQPVGWHQWTPPTDAQILARMKTRRAAFRPDEH